MSFLDPRAVRDWCRQKFVSNDDVLKTKEAVTANAEEGKVADALVVKEVFQSVSDGKALLASAITDKGVQTDANASFKVMAGNISQIESDGGNFNIGSVLYEQNGVKPIFNLVGVSYGGQVTVNPEEG